MIMSCRLRTQPAIPGGSPGTRGSRNHHTSMGAPNARERQPGGPADGRVPSVAADDQVGPELALRTGGVVAIADTDDAVAFVQQPGHLRPPPQGEGRLLTGRGGQQLEQVPLRDQGDVLVRSGQVAQVGHGDQASPR